MSERRVPPVVGFCHRFSMMTPLQRNCYHDGMMTRAQVQLTDEQLAALRQLSAESGRSIAELVRLGVELYLASQHRPSRDDQVRRALAVSGRFSSGARDVSSQHDRYLAEAFRE